MKLTVLSTDDKAKLSKRFKYWDEFIGAVMDLSINIHYAKCLERATNLPYSYTNLEGSILSEIKKDLSKFCTISIEKEEADLEHERKQEELKKIHAEREIHRQEALAWYNNLSEKEKSYVSRLQHLFVIR